MTILERFEEIYKKAMEVGDMALALEATRQIAKYTPPEIRSDSSIFVGEKKICGK